MSFFEAWSRQRAAKRMAEPLARLMAISYGGGKIYTEPQIRIAYGKLNLDKKYIDIAYAQYLSLCDYKITTSSGKISYDEQRALYKRYLSDKCSSTAVSSIINSYVAQGGGPGTGL